MTLESQVHQSEHNTHSLKPENSPLVNQIKKKSEKLFYLGRYFLAFYLVLTGINITLLCVVGFSNSAVQGILYASFIIYGTVFAGFGFLTLSLSKLVKRFRDSMTEIQMYKISNNLGAKLHAIFGLDLFLVSAVVGFALKIKLFYRFKYFFRKTKN